MKKKEWMQLGVMVSVAALSVYALPVNKKSQVERLMGATVLIDNPNLGGRGSGTVISSRLEDGRYVTLILTCYHVVDNAKELFADSYKYVGDKNVATSHDEVTIVRVDKENDLALLKYVRGDQYPDVAILAKEDPPPLSHLRIVGAALGHTPVVTEGIETDVLDGFIRSSAQIISGNSGGAVYNEKLELVGVPDRLPVIGGAFVSIPITHLGESVTISKVLEFLRGTKI